MIFIASGTQLDKLTGTEFFIVSGTQLDKLTGTGFSWLEQDLSDSGSYSFIHQRIH